MIQPLLSKKIRLLMTGLVITALLYSQHIPAGPVSYKVFAPLIVNPAIAGSKDFTRLHLHSLASGSFNSQAFSLHTRLPARSPGTANTGIFAYSNFGLGGYGYHEMLENSRNTGAGISAAFHIPLGAGKVSGLSIGASVHTLYNAIPRDSEFADTYGNSMIPGADAGIFVYGPYGFVGFSSRNLSSIFSDSVPRLNDEVSLPVEHLFFGGFKILLSRNKEIVLEPSLIANVNDSLFSAPATSITPVLKVYVENACFGSILQDLDSPSFFIQYQFPSFYLGVLAKLPGNELLIDNTQVRIEISAGLNLGRSARLYANQYRW